MIVSRLSSFLFIKYSLPHGCKSISSLLKNSFKVKLHLSQVTLPIILFSIISRDTTKEIINVLIKKLICDTQKKDKLIFDGYPRSLSQAKNLDLLLENSSQKIDFIFFLNVDKNTIIERIKKRKLLEKRSDDELNTILKRYDTYMETTRPVLDFYSENPNFHEINGTQEIDQITKEIETFINV